MIQTIDPPPKKKRAVFYPDSDGEPLAETDIHVLEIIALLTLLKHRYRERDNVYVATNNFVFYTEGIPGDRFSPDTYVVFEVPSHIRRSFKIWEESGIVPAIIFEVTSRKTKEEDFGLRRNSTPNWAC